MAKYVKTEQGYKEPTELVDSRFDSKMDKNNPVGTGSFSLNRKSGTIVGSSSFAEGYQTTASGPNSHAEGYQTTASGQYSHAEGESTKASSNSSHAEGYQTTASGQYSHAEGQSTKASDNSSHAEGYQTTASGSNSHAEGNNTTASGPNSHAEGCQTTASGAYSHAEGQSTKASDNSSHAEGYQTTASGSNSHAEGNNTTASGPNSHAEGYQTTASGQYSHAEGESTNRFSSVVTTTNPTNNDIITTWNRKKFSIAKAPDSHVEGRDNLALGDYSHAEGRDTIASGVCSHAEGRDTIASGVCSHAEGTYTTASGAYSHAEGSGATASGDGSHAEGDSTKASGSSQHVQGKFNIDDTTGTYSHIVGNGTGDSSRSNAHTLDWPGNAWYAGDVYVGSTSGTNKDEGSKKLATEEYVSTALGNYIPDPSLGITNATVGKIAKITAVDSNGKPTAWEPVDMASGGGGEADPPLLVDYTVPDGSTASSIAFTAADDGTAFNLNNRCYFVVDAIFPDSTSKVIGITSNGNVQGSGPFSPGNQPNVTVTEMHIFGKYTRDFGTRYTTWIQYRPFVNNCYSPSSSTQYGRADLALLMEHTKGTAVKSLSFIAMGTGDTIYWSPGTRVRIWGD